MDKHHEDDGLADVGEVDMFGLNEFGGPVGAEFYGSMIGAGVGALSSIIARQAAKPGSGVAKYSELLGGLVGAAAGAAMYAAGGKARDMAMTVVATSLVGNGLRQLEQSFLNKPVADQPAAGGLGIHTIEPGYAVPASGLGIHTIEPGYAVPASGLGAVTIDPAFPVQGSMPNGLGAARPELVGPPTLVGAGDYGMGENPAVAQSKLLGGPSVSALGAHYGATLFGHNS